MLYVYGASESELTIAQQFLDRCFKRRYISKKLEIGELLKVQDHRNCRKVSCIPNHPLRANFPATKTTRYNLRNKSPARPAIYTDRFKITFFNRIVFKYNIALKIVFRGFVSGRIFISVRSLYYRRVRWNV